MRISELAKLLNTSSKDLIQEMESLRDELTQKGHLLPSPIKAANRLEEDTIREVMAIFDRRRLEEQKAKHEEEELKRKEEKERTLREEQERLRIQGEERQRQAEERRRLADLEIERKQREVASRQEHESPAGTVIAPPPLPGPGTTPSEPVTAPPGIAASVPGVEGQPELVEDFSSKRPGPKKTRAKERAKPGKPTKEFTMEPMSKEFEQDDRRRDRRRHGDGGAAVARPGRRGVKPPEPEAPGSRRFRPSRLITVEDVPRRPPPAKPRQRPQRFHDEPRRSFAARTPVEEGPKVARFVGDFTLGEFAQKTGVALADLMRQLLMMGEALTINQMLDPDLAELLASEFGAQIEIVRESDDLDIEEALTPDAPENLKPRPPVVTVMGHVDHGKTTLLDSIRKTKVAEGEFGGITQHIGAYTVESAKGRITFLDTPGHEAFTQMRARGATMTDLVVLVVAANDGVMPQTVEAINHAKAAGVPIVVAINKIDVPGADPMRVKQELMKYDLVPEEFGGATICVPVSAKKDTGINELLDMILLQSEVLELRANPDRAAVGTVVESHVDPQRGAVATLLVQRGTLRPGDVILAGATMGRVRAMFDNNRDSVEACGPSSPVGVLGLSDPPPAGERFVVMENESEARKIADERVTRHRRRGLAKRERAHITLENLTTQLKEGKVKNLHLILKADVQGSLEAILGAIQKLPSDKVLPDVIHSGIGGINTSDVDLADASDAIVLGFNVGVDPQAREAADRTGVEIRLYQIIYDLIDSLTRAMLGLLDTKYNEVIQATAEVRQVFRSSRFGAVAGCFIAKGTLEKGHKVRVRRNGEAIHTGSISSLRRVRDDVNSVGPGLECGIGIENFSNIEPGDLLETFTLIEVAQEL